MNAASGKTNRSPPASRFVGELPDSSSPRVFPDEPVGGDSRPALHTLLIELPDALAHLPNDLAQRTAKTCADVVREMINEGVERRAEREVILGAVALLRAASTDSQAGFDSALSRLQASLLNLQEMLR